MLDNPPYMYRMLRVNFWIGDATAHPSNFGQTGAPSLPYLHIFAEDSPGMAGGAAFRLRVWIIQDDRNTI